MTTSRFRIHQLFAKKPPAESLSSEALHQLYTDATIGKLSCGILHDTMNMMSTLSLYLDELPQTLPQVAETQEYMDKLLLVHAKMHKHLLMVKKHMNTNPQSCVFEVNKEIDDAVALLKRRALQHKVTIAVEHRDIVTLYGTALYLHQAVFNIVANAIDAHINTSIDAERLVTSTIMRKRSHLKIVIADSGVGMTKEQVATLFTSCTSTKSQYCGTGIGLAHTYNLIRTAFQGTITVHSAPSQGSIFTIRIPLRTAPPSVT